MRQVAAIFVMLDEVLLRRTAYPMMARDRVRMRKGPLVLSLSEAMPSRRTVRKAKA
jgi:hypothetical protein